jgi:hypothetical protein
MGQGRVTRCAASCRQRAGWMVVWLVVVAGEARRAGALAEGGQEDAAVSRLRSSLVLNRTRIREAKAYRKKNHK